MPGIQLLQDIYENKGAAETRKHIAGNISVTEKLDAHRFSFQVNKDKTISFYKKNDNRPLTKIDRIISDLYEKAIYHINSIPHHIIRNIPEGMRFGFSYFPSERPLRLLYKFKPKNYLVLTDVSSRNPKGKVKKIHEDLNFLNRWAEVLEVSQPPILFKGVLEMEQVDMLMSVVNGNKKTNAFFTEHLEGVFSKTYTKNRIIEGIVIKSKHGLVQLRDPSYKIFDKATTPQVSRDFYDLTLLQIKEFMVKYEFPTDVDDSNIDERYIAVISDAFNKFIAEGLIDETFDPEFLRPKIIGSHGSLGKRHIKNNQTLTLVQKPLNEELFKVFLSAFRRKRKAYGLLTEGAIQSFNIIVEKLNEFAGSTVYSFNQYTKLYEDTNYDKGLDVDDADLKPDSFKVISSLQLAFTHKPKEKKLSKIKVKVVIGDFDPFNSDHLRIGKKQASKDTKIMYAHISHSKIGYSNLRFQCSDDLVDKMLARIATDESEHIAGHIILPYHSIAKVFSVCRRHDMEPMELIVPTGSGPNYMSQLYMEEQVLGKRLYTDQNFEIKEMKNSIHTKVRRAIEDMNFKGFKDVTPESIHGFWDSITTEYRTWAGINPSRVQN